jgi:lipocalin-like protein
LGPKPDGQVMYDSTGSVYVLLFDPDRPPFVSGDRLRGTTQETQSAYEGSIAYYGRYTVDQTRSAVTHHVLGSTYPNWIGTDLVRYYKIDGRRLTLTTAPFVQGGKRITAVNTFERIR